MPERRRHRLVRLDDAVAVAADHMGAAKKGLAALVIEWDDGPHAKLETTPGDHHRTCRLRASRECQLRQASVGSVNVIPLQPER
jgi:hypothetical protein